MTTYKQETLKSLKTQAVDTLKNAGEWAPSPSSIRLLGASVKTEKGAKLRVKTSILYMSPGKSRIAGQLHDACPLARLCRGPCLEAAGQLGLSVGNKSKRWKTALYILNKDLFEEILERELKALESKAKGDTGWTYAVRLNGTSDNIDTDKFAYLFPWLQFYEYTKVPERTSMTRNGTHWTFSLQDIEQDEKTAAEMLRNGTNVAMVLKTRDSSQFPEWLEMDGQWFPTINGDETDARFLDKPGHIVLLTFKGGNKKMERADERFVIPMEVINGKA